MQRCKRWSRLINLTEKDKPPHRAKVLGFAQYMKAGNGPTAQKLSDARTPSGRQAGYLAEIRLLGTHLYEFCCAKRKSEPRTARGRSRCQVADDNSPVVPIRHEGD